VSTGTTRSASLNPNPNSDPNLEQQYESVGGENDPIWAFNMCNPTVEDIQTLRDPYFTQSEWGSLPQA
jgi:hypothetical protein